MPKSSSSSSLVIVDGLRTAIGSPFKSLKNFSAVDLGAVVIKRLLNNNRVLPSRVGKVILGNVVSAGLGQNMARQSAILAGLPVSTEAFTVNHVCASGLQSMILGMHALMCEDHSFVICGGAESASQSPILCSSEDGQTLDTTTQAQSLLKDGLFCNMTEKHMGQLCERLAKSFRISRKVQDEYTIESHRKACQAQLARKFSPEIVGVEISGPLGNYIISKRTENRSSYRQRRFSRGARFENDERPRKKIDWEKLNGLPPAFEKNGTISAGNSSVPSDGAAGVILSTSSLIKKSGHKSIADILGYASIAVAPQDVFLAGITAMEVCLKKCGLTVKDVDLFEISEAFAAQAILTQNKVKIPESKMNVWGGDIAFGHPLGAAGVRALVTLLHALKDQKKEIGIVCACLGGGGAVAVAVRRH